MFGGRRFNPNSELLRDKGDDKSNIGGSIASVNDGLFQQINEAENHAKQILKTGQSQYVDGIKQNILDMVRAWLQEEGSNVFTLYGKMGCGKSFFSARLYQDIGTQEELYDTVAFSSQQLYRDTTIVRNMLLSIAHQLFNTVPTCTAFFAKYQLTADSLSALTEEVFVKPFEGVILTKTVFIIVDGLDEYPREDCEILLETLGKLRMRLNPRVKIYFSSRPEAYVMSEMINDSERSSYHIEKNTNQSHADCAHFIDVKCSKAGIQINESMKRSLIEKSECSLKYLECFFNDIACGAIHVTADFIESLPMGLSHYYRDQLVRYFGDEGLRFYQTKIVPLLEILCVAWRPITIQDASDILGCRESEINNIISRSGTLLWRNNRYVMLYQSESIREFLMDERYCPEKYRIDSQNGNDRILQRLEEIMDSGEELESNLYLFNCAVDHILGKERILNADWALLVRIVANYPHKADVMAKLAKGVLERSPREIAVFLRTVYNDGKLAQLLKDRTAVRLLGAAIQDKQNQKLQDVLELLEDQEEYDFIVSYWQIRILRNDGKNEESLALLQPHLTLADEEPESIFRHIHYLDETSRIYRKLEMVTWEENTDFHIQVVQEGEQLLQKIPAKNAPAHMVAVNSLAVSYDQLARLCDKLENITDSAIREACGQKLLAVLKMPDCAPSQPGFFLLAEEAAFQKELKLSKICQQCDPFSDGRIHQLHYSFYALGILYFRKDFPGYSPDKALQYFEDCLSSIEEIALRPESHIRFIDVAVKLYGRLYDIYTKDGQFASARKYLGETRRMKDLRYLYHPSADTDFSRCYGFEQEADLVLAEQGIEAAETYYLTALQHYQECCKKYPDRFVQRSLSVIYYRIAKHFKEAENLEKYVYYTRKELEETERLYGLYPTKELRWDWGVTLENLASALRKLDASGTLHWRIDLQKSAIAIYKELAAAYPQVEKYVSAPFISYYLVAIDCRDALKTEESFDYLDAILSLGPRIAALTRKYDRFLDLPIRLFLTMHHLITDQTTRQNYMVACKTYAEAVREYSKTDDFGSMWLHLLRQEAQDTQKEQGFPAAEPLLLELAQQAKDHAAAYPSSPNYYQLAYVYVMLHEGYLKAGTRGSNKSIRYLQEALNVLSLGLQQWSEAADLLELQAALYGRFAAILKRSADADTIAQTVDLYSMQIADYVVLYKIAAEQTQKDRFGKLTNDAYKALESYLHMQEGFLKRRLDAPATPKETIRRHLKAIVAGYGVLARFKTAGTQEKLEHYEALLAQWESEE